MTTENRVHLEELLYLLHTPAFDPLRTQVIFEDTQRNPLKVSLVKLDVQRAGVVVVLEGKP